MSTQNWQTLVADPFIFHYRPDTTAERSAMLVHARLVAAHEATVRILAADGPTAPMAVYLLDSADDDVPSGARRIASVYRDDAPGETLERGLVELLLAQTCPFVIDGVLGFVTQQSGRTHRGAGGQALDDRVRHGKPVDLRALISGPRLPGDPLYFQAATTFVGFLIATYGPVRFRLFAATVETADPDAAVERAFGKPLVVLEKHWVGTLRTRQHQLLGVGGLLHAMATLDGRTRAWRYSSCSRSSRSSRSGREPADLQGHHRRRLLQKNTRLLTVLITVLFALLVAKPPPVRADIWGRLAALSTNTSGCSHEPSPALSRILLCALSSRDLGRALEHLTHRERPVAPSLSG